MMRHMVFVYGTLKRNEPNHDWITDKSNGCATFHGTAVTKEKFPLVIGSRYNIPYLLAAQGIGKNVEGEVYDVDDAMLSQLDILESHPTYYERKMGIVIMKNSEKEVDCWIYLLHRYKPHMLQLPFLQSYSSRGSHGLEYIVRYLRKNPGAEYWTDVKNCEDISDPEDI